MEPERKPAQRRLGYWLPLGKISGTKHHDIGGTAKGAEENSERILISLNQ